MRERRGKGTEEAEEDTVSLSTEKETEDAKLSCSTPNNACMCVCIWECVSLAVLISVGVIDRVVESAEQSD